MKNTIFFAPVFLLLLVSQGCKKTETVFTSPLVNNKWRVVDAELGTAQSYMLFSSNGHVVYLQNDSFNSRTIQRGFFDDDGTSIALQLSNVRAFKPVYSGDTCYLQRGNGNNEYILVKDNTAPDENAWAPEPVYIDSLQRLSATGGSLGYYPPRILQITSFTDVGYYTDLTTNISGSAALAQQCINFDINAAGDVWVAKYSDANLYKVSPSNFSTIFTSAPAPYRIDAVAIGTGVVYAWAASQQLLYTYNIAGDSFDAGVKTPSSYNDFALSGNYLYCTRYGYIDKYDLTTHKIVKTWRVKTDGSLGGIATDGTYFYVESGYSYSDIGHILKLILN